MNALFKNLSPRTMGGGDADADKVHDPLAVATLTLADADAAAHARTTFDEFRYHR